MIKSFALLLLCICSVLLAATVEFPTFNSTVRMNDWRAVGISKKTAVVRTDHFWVAFRDVLYDSLRVNLQNLGATVTECAGWYGTHCVYKIDAGGRFDAVIATLQATPYFYNITPVTVEDKVDEAIWSGKNLQYADSAAGVIRGVVTMYRPISRMLFVQMTSGLVNNVQPGDSIAWRFTVISTPADLIELARLDDVREVIAHRMNEPLSFHSREITGVNQLQAGFVTNAHPPAADWLTGVKYTGDSIWIDINEPGAFTHLDFCEIMGRDTVLRNVGARVKRRDGAGLKWGFDEHGTHMAAIAAGNGWLSMNNARYPADTMHWRGVAPKALLIPQYLDAGDVNNHSFTENGHYYNAWSRYNDYINSNHSIGGDAALNNVSIYAVANNGSGRNNGSLQFGYYSILANNKNSIAVGATEKGRPIIGAFSSLGPTRDGRIRPDVMAPGTGLLNAGWHIEMDSIALIHGINKHNWGFGPGQPGWGGLTDVSDNVGISNLVQTNGIMSFDAAGSSFFFSELMYPASTVISARNDTLYLKWKITGLLPISPTTLWMSLYWKRPRDAYAKADNPFSIVSFMLTATGGWQESRIWLNDPANSISNGGWVDGDTLQRLRLDFMNSQSDVVSAFHDDRYEGPTMHGTSQACAHLSGIAALMLQKYRDEILKPRSAGLTVPLNIHDNPPWNSTVRAILAHTATDLVDTIGQCIGLGNPDFAAAGINSKVIYGVGPDWATGYGLVNAVKALAYVDTLKFRENVVSQGGSATYYFTVPAAATVVRASLCWDDPANANVALADAQRRKLVNDLDLYLVSPGGTTYRPWTLDDSWMQGSTIPDSGLDPLITPAKIKANGPVKGIDVVNNLEVVDVVFPAAGTWQLVVAGKSILIKQSTRSGTTQDFSVVCDYALRTAPAATAPQAVNSTDGAVAVQLPSRGLPVQATSETSASTLLSSGPGLLSDQPPAGTTVLPGWKWSRTILLNTTSCGADIAQPVFDFPVLIELDHANFQFIQAAPDGRDVRFTSVSRRALTYEIVQWDSQRGVALVRVLVPRLEALSSANRIVMHWGNSKARRQSGRVTAPQDVRGTRAPAWIRLREVQQNRNRIFVRF